MRKITLHGTTFEIRFIDTPQEMRLVEDLQDVVWPGSERDIVPDHILLPIARSGGVVLGAFPLEEHPKAPLAGFVYGFPCMEREDGEWHFQHCSHQMGVHPVYRGLGLSYWLKRAQWQWVRHQGLDRIVWTYDPLLSRNAHLNIRKLGGICRTYYREYYGPMRDGLNAGLPSDRFLLELWVNSNRTLSRMRDEPPQALDLAHYMSAGAIILNPSGLRADGVVEPPATWREPEGDLALVEIPVDFLALKAADMETARRWRFQTREIFETLFARGYIVTDFVHLPGKHGRSFYVLSHGEATLG